MTDAPLEDASRDRSVLLILARMKRAGRLDWLKAGEARDLVDRLENADSKRLAKAILEDRKTGLSPRDSRELLHINRLAAK